MLDKVLFHSKHWQVFLMFVIGFVLLEFSGPGANMFAATMYLLWLPLIGVRLMKFLPPYYKVHYRMFQASWVVMVMAFVYSYFISTRSESAAFRLIFIVVGYTCFFTMLAFIARGIKSLQTNDRATVNSYFGDIFLLLLFFPLGVWLIQPRLNILGDQFYR